MEYGFDRLFGLFTMSLLNLQWLANARKVLHNELHYFNADVLGFGRFCILRFPIVSHVCMMTLLIADLEDM